MEKKEQKSFKYWVNSSIELFLLSEYVVLNYVGSWEDQCIAHLGLCLLQEYIASRVLFLNSLFM